MPPNLDDLHAELKLDWTKEHAQRESDERNRQREEERFRRNSLMETNTSSSPLPAPTILDAFSSTPTSYHVPSLQATTVTITPTTMGYPLSWQLSLTHYLALYINHTNNLITHHQHDNNSHPCLIRRLSRCIIYALHLLPNPFFILRRPTNSLDDDPSPLQNKQTICITDLLLTCLIQVVKNK